MADCSTIYSDQLYLKPDSELRFQIGDNSPKVNVELIHGTAEVFGTELLPDALYEFVAGTKVAIFTYHGCVLKIRGRMDTCCIATNTPMMQYWSCHDELEQLRKKAELRNGFAPRVMVVGPADAGKRTLCRLLVNYAVRDGHHPLYVDLDVEEGAHSIPGIITMTLATGTASIEQGFVQRPQFMLHFGHQAPSVDNTLYRGVVTKMAEKTLQILLSNSDCKRSGIIINSSSTETGTDYENLLHTARVYGVNVVLVLGQERLFHELLCDLTSSVNVVLLPKSDGVVERNSMVRHQERVTHIEKQFSTYAFSIDVKFEDLNVYKFDHFGELFEIRNYRRLMYHILSITYTDSVEAATTDPKVACFVWVTGVNTKRSTLQLASPQPAPLPNTIFLASDMRFAPNA